MYGEKLVIGRSSKCDLKIDDPRVSSMHCVIERDQATQLPFIRNESLNGIEVIRRGKSEKKLKERSTLMPLEDGDQLRLVTALPIVAFTFKLANPRTAKSECVTMAVGLQHAYL